MKNLKTSIKLLNFHFAQVENTYRNTVITILVIMLSLLGLLANIKCQSQGKKKIIALKVERTMDAGEARLMAGRLSGKAQQELEAG